MKKIIIGLLWATLLAGSAYAGSAIMRPKPQIQDVLTPDVSGWTGVKYNGVPVNAGPDAIGHNVNYIYQVTMIANTINNLRVQIYMRAFAPLAYSMALNNLSAVNSALGITGIKFQDSGIVMPRAMYFNMMKTATTLDWSWQIILSYDVPASEATAFKNDLVQWVVGKLPQHSSNGTTTYYWK